MLDRKLQSLPSECHIIYISLRYHFMFLIYIREWHFVGAQDPPNLSLPTIHGIPPCPELQKVRFFISLFLRWDIEFASSPSSEPALASKKKAQGAIEKIKSEMNMNKYQLKLSFGLLDGGGCCLGWVGWSGPNIRTGIIFIMHTLSLPRIWTIMWSWSWTDQVTRTMVEEWKY